MTVRHSSIGRSTTGTRSSPRAAPALFTTMSTRPNSSTTAVGERVDRVGIGHVADDRERAPAEGADLVGDRLDVAPAGGLLVVGVALGRAAGAGEHDVAPGAGELHRDRPADRTHAPGTGDDRHLALEPGQESVRSCSGVWRTLPASSARPEGAVVTNRSHRPDRSPTARARTPVERRARSREERIHDRMVRHLLRRARPRRVGRARPCRQPPTPRPTGSRPSGAPRRRSPTRAARRPVRSGPVRHAGSRRAVTT